LPLRAPEEKRKEGAPPPHWEDREPTGCEEPELRTTTVVEIYLACTHLLTEPATTTSPPHSEHHTANLSFPPPFVLFL
jgi:hypothetical protein